MIYKVILSKKAQKQLSKQDKVVAERILKYLHKHIDGSENPRIKGKALSGNQSGKWRYRVGDYRVICEIKDEKLIVLALTVGHRKEIYE